MRRYPSGPGCCLHASSSHLEHGVCSQHLAPWRTAGLSCRHSGRVSSLKPYEGWIDSAQRTIDRSNCCTGFLVLCPTQHVLRGNARQSCRRRGLESLAPSRNFRHQLQAAVAGDRCSISSYPHFGSGTAGDRCRSGHCQQSYSSGRSFESQAPAAQQSVLACRQSARSL